MGRAEPWGKWVQLSQMVASKHRRASGLLLQAPPVLLGPGWSFLDAFFFRASLMWTRCPSSV